MTIIHIQSTELSSPIVPNQANDYLTQDQWNNISKDFRAELLLAWNTTYSCECCSLILSCCLCLPCLVYYHSINEEEFYKQNALKINFKYNTMYFNGESVLVYEPNSFGIDTEAFELSHPSVPTSAIVLSQISDHGSTLDSTSNLIAGIESTTTQSARVFKVTIPAGTQPGSTIIVLAPDNITQIQVHLPSNIEPGQTIDVAY